VDEKMSRTLLGLGEVAGRLSDRAAGWTGLPAGIAVAVANVDAHVSAPAASVTEPGTMVAIMGTSICDIVLSETAPAVPGICGVVRDGVVPGLYGFEAGQASVGDLFGWFVEHAVPPTYHDQARLRGVSVHEVLEEAAGTLRPGESGLLALDWWNGNRSVLVDAAVGGLLIGATLATVPEEIYRALVEATAFGTRVIVETFRTHGVPIHEIVACGGLAEKSPMIMQVYADIVGLPFRISASEQTPALGSAMFGAVAAGVGAGGHATIEDASRAMARLKDVTYEPIPDHQATYDVLYREYVRLHDYFGRGENDVMKTLRRLRDAARAETAEPAAAAGAAASVEAVG
jgi:L-ribulokinase